MTEATNTADANARPAGLTEVSSSDGDAAHAALIGGINLAGSLLAQIFDVFGRLTGFPSPQVPHTFAAAFGDVIGMAGADPENGAEFRAGLSHEAYAEVLATQVRENYLLSVTRNVARLEAAGASSYEELAAALEGAEDAPKH
jgi:hypothetical protein